jgi:hypothetical protein
MLLRLRFWLVFLQLRIACISVVLVHRLGNMVGALLGTHVVAWR